MAEGGAAPGKRPSPIRETDDEAFALAAKLCREAHYGALAALDPESGRPVATRIAFAMDGSHPVTLVSDLSSHTNALKADGRCSLLVGEPGRGDPLAHPRVTLHCDARSVERRNEEHRRLRTLWLAAHPKAELYIDFADFGFWRFEVARASLNGGFGKAYELTGEEFAEAFV